MSKPEIITTSQGYRFKFYHGAGFSQVCRSNGLLLRTFNVDLADAIEEAILQRHGLWLASNGFLVMRVPGNDNGDGRCVRVLDPDHWLVTHHWDNHRRRNFSTCERGLAAIDEWFEAHPVEEPKPWLDAKEDEVWDVITNFSSFRAMVKETTLLGGGIGMVFSGTQYLMDCDDSSIVSAVKVLDAPDTVTV